MRQGELKAWVDEYFGEGRWLDFVAKISALRLAQGRKAVTASAANQWLYGKDKNGRPRNPPAWVDDCLPLIEVRLANPEKPHLYQITLALDADGVRRLERAARDKGISVEQVLTEIGNVGFDEVVGVD